MYVLHIRSLIDDTWFRMKNKTNRILICLQSVQDELVSLNLQLNMSEEKSNRLQKENQELIDRWMARMGREAEAMNNASKFS